ncbi:uncharacterized protein BDV17DRAFT_244389 [Aspergillus undulatus]|uniref:uncharacterized protein n=1 Tax=Aspergillus undulatus TaxID=1810928 RepID=UPI003CCE01D3
MPATNQIKVIENSEPSDAELENHARELTSKNVTIDPAKSFPKSFSITDASVIAVLVYKKGSAGAVRVTGPNTPQPVPNVVTGTDETGLEIIEVKEGQTCMFFGNPAVRYFR